MPYDERAELSDYISDTYKEINGVRPRHIDFWNTDLSELKAIADDLTEEAKRHIEYEEQRELELIAEFEHQISSNIQHGACDRATAIRWIVQALETDLDDPGYICYLLQIPYNYEAEIKDAIDGETV